MSRMPGAAAGGVMNSISIILPARNEAAGLRQLLPELVRCQPRAEIIVVDSGSHDDTAAVAESHGVRVVSQPYAYGNGAAVKAGIRAARGEVLVFMDADGQHSPRDVDALLEKFHAGYDMVVGARLVNTNASLARRLANGFYNRFASWITGHRIEDLTSGLRVARADYAREFLHLLPNGFSYPTTMTMAFFRSGFSVGYVPTSFAPRIGRSHVNPWRDGLRFLLIIFRIGTLYSPLKVFFPLSLLNLCAALGYYAYTYVTMHSLTNMSVILFSAALVTFLIGLLSEQITSVYYSIREHRRRE